MAYNVIWPDLDADKKYDKIQLKSNKPKGGWTNGVFILQGNSGNIESDKLSNVCGNIPDGEGIEVN